MQSVPCHHQETIELTNISVGSDLEFIKMPLRRRVKYEDDIIVLYRGDKQIPKIP